MYNKKLGSKRNITVRNELTTKETTIQQNSIEVLNLFELLLNTPLKPDGDKRRGFSIILREDQIFDVLTLLQTICSTEIESNNGSLIYTPTKKMLKIIRALESIL